MSILPRDKKDIQGEMGGDLPKALKMNTYINEDNKNKSFLIFKGGSPV